MPHLVIVEPGGNQQRYVLDQPEYVLGRDPGAHISLPDRKVSRKHARIFTKGDAYWVEDLGSANGVVIDGRPITGPRKLSAGSVLDIGGFQITVREAAEDGAATAFCLVGLNAPFASQTFMLPVGELPVGRVAGCAIVIPDVSISRKHATLDVAPGGVTVEDHGSSNGTWVNDTRVGRRALNNGDRVRFGNVEFEYMLAGRSAGVASRGWTRFARADRAIQIAVIIGALSVILLAVTIVVALRRSTPGDGANPGQTAEQRYFAAIDTDLASARAAAAAGSWTDAERAFQHVLDRDPINREARRGLASARGNIEDHAILGEARSQLKAGKAELALATLQRVGTDRRYADAAGELAERARAAVAKTALTGARKACRRSDWRACHRLAIRVLEHQPDSVPGQALLSESENAMRAQRVAFTPWAPPRAAGTAYSPKLESVYPDDEVRHVVMRYAAGDLDTAVHRARTAVDRPGGSSLAQTLSDFRTAWTAGNGAAVAGDLARAIQSWKDALAADAKILPDNQPSAFRDKLRRRLSAELYRLGDAAFGRGDYGAAFEPWSAGLRYNPADPKLLGGLARLESRAEAMLADIPARGNLRRDKCSRLRQILAMTRPESRVHAGAKKRKSSGCRK